MAEPKYHGMKVVDINQGEVRGTIRRSLQSDRLRNCRAVVIVMESRQGGLRVQYSCSDPGHAAYLLEKARSAIVND